MHMGTIFGTLTLVTGSIWAKTSGVWWSWGERQLVLFLVLFLWLRYFMLRFRCPTVPAGPASRRSTPCSASC